MDLEAMFKGKFSLTVEETQFLYGVHHGTETALNVKRIDIEMYSIKHTEVHTRAMRYLTFALVFVGVVQVVVAILAIFFSQPCNVLLNQ